MSSHYKHLQWSDRLVCATICLQGDQTMDLTIRAPHAGDAMAWLAVGSTPAPTMPNSTPICSRSLR
jgi:hypothetical protein